MEITNKDILELKTLLEKDYGREFTSKELESAYNTLIALSEVVYTIATEEMERQKLLAESPNGLIIKGMGDCPICRSSITNKDSWFDNSGAKCLICHEAIIKKIIPNSVATDSESWYTMFDLLNYFNFNTRFVKKLIKESVLKCRTIYNEEGRIHLRLFLLKDNKGVFPPKKLLKSRHIQVIRNDEQYYTNEMWYDYLDEKLARRLRKYSVMQFLQESLAMPIEVRQAYFKLNPLFKPRDI